MKKKLNLDVLVRVVVVLATAKSTFILKFDFLKATVRILNSHANLPSRGSKITGLFLVYNGRTVLVQWCTYSKFSTALYYS